MNSECVNPKVVIVITKQINEMKKSSPPGVKIIPNDNDILDIQADIEGPEETPYFGGVFRTKLVVPADFPRSPPRGYFLTKIFHPNVSERGEICVNSLKKDWNPAKWSLYNIFEVVRCLLIVPFPESALNEEAGKMFMENYDEYFKYAKLLTELYSMPNEKEAHGHAPKPQLQKAVSMIETAPMISQKQIQFSSAQKSSPSNQQYQNANASNIIELMLVKENLNNTHNMAAVKHSQDKGQQETGSYQSNCMNNMMFGSMNMGMTQSYPMMGQMAQQTTKDPFNINFPMIHSSGSIPEKMQEEVLTTVTNSFNTTPAIFNFFPCNELKKMGGLNSASGSANGLFGGLNNSNLSSVTNKKENDKKKWLKRI